MGHYDDAIEAEYERQRIKEDQERKFVVPLILNHLDQAGLRLSQNSRLIEFSKEFNTQISLIKLALKAQLK